MSFLSSTTLYASIGVLSAVCAALIVFSVILLFKRSAKNALILAIKDKLSGDGTQQSSSITLTKNDEYNRILLELDELSDKLVRNVKGRAYQKDNMQAILENVNMGIIALDKSKKIQIANVAAKNFFSFEDEGIELSYVIRNLEVQNAVSRVGKTRTAEVLDYNALKGQILELNILPVKSGRLDIIIIAEVVTEVRKLQKEKEDFFVNASHELNTPLTGIKGYVELLIKEGKYKKEFVEAIELQSNKMHALVSDMLALNQIEKVKISLEPVKLDAVVAEVLETFKLSLEQKKLTLKQNIKGAVIAANRIKIAELISNLLDNAIKYTGEGGTIEVSVAVDASTNQVILKIKDTGIGISEQNQPRIFERFYRVDKSRSTSGTGLGLAIVKHIVAAHGATITMSSTIGIGTEFVVSFKN